MDRGRESITISFIDSAGNDVPVSISLSRPLLRFKIEPSKSRFFEQLALTRRLDASRRARKEQSVSSPLETKPLSSFVTKRNENHASGRS